MTPEYESVYKDLGIPILARKMARGDIRIPVAEVNQGFAPFNFPPALIPLWCKKDSNDYVGYWQHWFDVKRASTIVRMSSQLGCKVREESRNLPQLLRMIVQIQIFIARGVDSDIENFAKKVGINDLDLIEEIESVHADNTEGLFHHPLFKRNAPLSILLDVGDYNGEFPNEAISWTKEALSKVCSLEISESVLRNILDQGFKPSWLTEGDVSLFFDQCLEEGKLTEAWLALNTTGWSFPKAKEAIKKLSKKAQSVQFNRLTIAWLSCPHRNEFCY